MSVRIRLRRMGAKKRPFYRFVAADQRFARDGRFLETIGYYNPMENPAKVVVHEEKIFKWLKEGAQMSETVASPRFAETMSQQMEGSLEFWAMVRRQVGEATEQYLQQMNMPTQSEVVGLAERLTTIEMRLDDIEAKLDQVLDRLTQSQDS